MKSFRDKGAVGAILDEYEKALEALIETIAPVSDDLTIYQADKNNTLDLNFKTGISTDAQAHIQAELLAVDAELPLRIDNYNHQIKKLDGDLKKGLNKRQTKSQIKKHRAELMVDPGQEKLDSLDQEKQKFAKALFQKK